MTNKEALKTLIDTYSKGAKLSKRESKIYEHGLLDGIQFSKWKAEQLPRWKKEDFISSLPEEPVSEDLEEVADGNKVNMQPPNPTVRIMVRVNEKITGFKWLRI